MKNKRKLKEIISADFETTTSEPVKVWLWGYCDITATERHEVKTGTSISDFMLQMFKKAYNKSLYVYFFNLKFDGTFIIWWLEKNNFELRKEVKDMTDKTYNTLIDDKGVIYQIKVKWENKLITFRCAYRLCLSSLKDVAKSFNCKYQKTSIDYTAHDNETEVTDDEIKYIQEDVLIQADFLNHYYNMFNHVALTVGGQALYEYKKEYKNELKNWWVQLNKNVDEFIRCSYKGGVCYVNPLYKNKIINCKNGGVYDYNSMYPSMLIGLSNNYYPVGNPIFFNGCDFEKIKNKYLYVVRISCKFKIKQNKLPTVVDIGSAYCNLAWATESKTQTDLTLCCVDFENFFKNYDVYDLKIIKGYYFKKKVKGICDRYIKKYYEMKKNETGAKKIFAKYMLNALTGKFGQRINGQVKYFNFTNLNEPMTLTTEDEERKGVYLPWVVFITAYSRRTLSEAVNDNFENFLYCDTDSIHLKDISQIKINEGKDLLQWKFENKIIKCKYIRPKCYIDKISENDYNIKIAGLPEKARINTHNDDNFKVYYIGAIFKNVKLIPKLSVGGVRLVTTDYTLKDS